MCHSAVPFDKTFYIDRHRASLKHKGKLEQEEDRFVEMVTKAFVSANIPLYKLRNPELRQLFAGIDLLKQPVVIELTFCSKRK